MTASPTIRTRDIAPRAGPRLTVYQRAILTRLVAQLHAVDQVRAQLVADHPDFPTISDDLIRYYRRKLDAETLHAAQTLGQQALQTRLARKVVRIGQLIRMAEQLRRVPLVEATLVVDERGQPRTVYQVRVDVSRELRAILKQIAQELGQFAVTESPRASLDEASPAGENDESADDAIRADLEELLRRATERAENTSERSLWLFP